MRSPRAVYIETIRSLCTDKDRFVDIGARVRVYKRGPDGSAVPDYWLPWTYGGRFDRLTGRYVGPPESWSEIKIHPGQLGLIESLHDPQARHITALGSQGGGKTEGIVAAAQILCIWKPNRIVGGVAPTQKRLRVLRKKFINQVGPRGWIKEVRAAEDEVELWNGTIVQWVSMKKQSAMTGSPAAGKDWHDAFGDETQNMTNDDLQEIDARGRINPGFRFIGSATNDPITEFQVRLRDSASNPEHRIYRFTGPDNVFLKAEHWEWLRRNWPPDDYRRKILCEDVPLEGRSFPTFSIQQNIRALPPRPQIGSLDITAEITAARYRHPYQLIAATDFGSLTTVTIFLRAFRGGLWWAVGELTTENQTTQVHGQKLIEHPLIQGDVSRFIVIGDPHEYQEVDRSDYTMLKRMGINAVRAAASQGGVGNTKIDPKHRRSMLNSLLLDANGERHLFIEPGACPRLVNSLNMSMLGLNGKPERAIRRDRAHLGDDLTDHPDALMFGLYPFERIRGVLPVKEEQWDSNTSTPPSRPRLQR